MKALQIQKIMNVQMAKRNFKAAKLSLKALNVQRLIEGMDELRLPNLESK